MADTLPSGDDAARLVRAHADCYLAWLGYFRALIVAGKEPSNAAWLDIDDGSTEDVRALFVPFLDVLLDVTASPSALRAALVPLRVLVKDEAKPADARVLDAAATYARRLADHLTVVTTSPIVG